MKKTRKFAASNFDFVEHAQDYEKVLDEGLCMFGESHQDFAQYKLNYLQSWLDRLEKGMAILDFGCGIGKLAKLTAKTFPHSTVYGYDISMKAIEIAERQREGVGNLIYTCELPVGQTFHLIIAANVFHHIKPKDLPGAIQQLKTLLAPGGNIVIFEHNPWNPLTRYVVHTCPLDANASLIPCRKFVRLARSCGLKINVKRYIVFFPKVLSFLRRFEPHLGFLPLGAQYMLSLEVEEKRDKTYDNYLSRIKDE